MFIMMLSSFSIRIYSVPFCFSFKALETERQTPSQGNQQNNMQIQIIQVDS